MEGYIDFFNSYIIGSVQMLLGFTFFLRFLQKKGRLIFYLLFVLIDLAAVLMAPVGSAAEFLLYTLFLAGVGIWLCRADWKSVVLYAALTVELMELCQGMANSLSGMLYPWMSTRHPHAAATVSISMGIAAVMLAAVCYCAVCRYFLFSEATEKQYLFLFLIPVLMIFFMDEYICSVIYGNETVQNMGGRNIPVNHYQMFVIQLFGMASLFCLMFAYKKLLWNFHLRTELSLLEQEEASLNQYVEEARARYEKTKSFRHDIKNHITVVKELLRSEKKEEAIAYIGDLADMTEELSFPCGTGNPVADILLGNKLGAAKGMGIDVSCSLLLPYPCPIRDIDFCIILSNALDNAIHACRDINRDTGKYIRVSGRMQGDLILMDVENSFQKKGHVGQGTGLSNIKTVAEKYQGAMSIKTQDDSFLLSVLLVIPRQEESIPRQIG